MNPGNSDPPKKSIKILEKDVNNSHNVNMESQWENNQLLDQNQNQNQDALADRDFEVNKLRNELRMKLSQVDMKIKIEDLQEDDLKVCNELKVENLPKNVSL
eukprot:CAMPEP_0116892352 /NCGR_PEP_ID=MMETSP0467-20121206/2601_1 /TAXON_ID=283647 /ORGANISM="Mesodinium pulex, Strain SPMC105" /LENGTH=101 /DNA_ID=CAMNT_0004561447 /DNA_START=39 /DNA_END=344 /DNA_ORIENTATION=-